MGRIDKLKKLGGLAARVAGLAGSDDKAKRLEAEKDLLELRLDVLDDTVGDLLRAIEPLRAPDASAGLVQTIGGVLRAADEARQRQASVMNRD